MKTILIRPSCNEGYIQSVDTLRAIEPPIWIAIMSNMFSEPVIIDAEADNLNEEGIYNKIKLYDIDTIEILATGSHPSAHIQQLDEAEKIKAYLKTKLDCKINVYSKLPFNPIEKGKPNWSLLDMSKYRTHNWHGWGRANKNYGTIFSSISCPFSCKFCTVKDFYGVKYQTRYPEKVVQDVVDLYKNHGITNFKMMDELFATTNARIFNICDMLQDGIAKKINIWAYARLDTVSNTLLRHLRKGGVKWLAYGIESGNEDIRKQVSKGSFSNKKIKDIIKMTKDNDINVLGNYMFGFWDDTIDTMKQTLDLALELNTEYSNFYCVTAYPNTDIFDHYKKLNIKMPKKSYEYAQLSEHFLPLPTKTLKGSEVLKFRDDAFKIYNTHINYLTYMQKRFGEETVKDIASMLSKEIVRKNIND